MNGCGDYNTEYDFGEVAPPNSPPVIDAIDDATTSEDIPLTIVLSASDVDGDLLIYSAVSDTSTVLFYFR